MWCGDNRVVGLLVRHSSMGYRRVVNDSPCAVGLPCRRRISSAACALGKRQQHKKPVLIFDRSERPVVLCLDHVLTFQELPMVSSSPHRLTPRTCQKGLGCCVHTSLHRSAVAAVQHDCCCCCCIVTIPAIIAASSWGYPLRWIARKSFRFQIRYPARGPSFQIYARPLSLQSPDLCVRARHPGV